MARAPRQPNRSGHPKRLPQFGTGVTILALLAAAAGFGQTPSAGQGPVFARSHSGQFVVQATADVNPEPLTPAGVQLGLMRVNPTLLPVSCERIRYYLWRELGVSGPWAGKVYLGLRPIRMPDEPLTLVREHFRDGWQYRVDLPDTVERSRYVRAVVQVLLLELANRGAGDRSAEVPAWLVEGLAGHLLAAHELEIILQPPPMSKGPLRVDPTVVQKRVPNPLQGAHEWFSTNQPLSFDELSWPTPEHFGNTVSERYRHSAQLFVTELLRLPDGQRSLRSMLEQLPQFHNWQFAFFAGFGSHFQRPLEVEKWWALQVVHFTGRDLGQTWGVDESCQKLRETLRMVVEVRAGPGVPPRPNEVSLQTIIREWELEQQRPVLQARIAELAQLQVRVAPGLAGAVDSYRATLERYLREREHPGGMPFRKKAALRQVVEDTVKSLDDLDAQTTGFMSLRERARTLTNSLPPDPQQVAAERRS